MDSELSNVAFSSAKAAPTKDFFVSMLTRDIELGDALLDLLDNCLDGVLRSAAPTGKARPYEGYWARMTLSPDAFIIEDNCGGIPFDVATKYAFAMGRPSGVVDSTSSTIGMYGIGMKRAIFKMGRQAIVQSRHEQDGSFQVEFTPEWMESDSWDDLPMLRAPGALNSPGTRITVTSLTDDTKSFFSSAENVDLFRKVVAQHYSLILDKGFKVSIGSPQELAESAELCTVKPERFALLSTPGEGGIQPHVYRGEIAGVQCEIYAGLYRPLLSAQELEIEEEKRGTSDGAGWIVACNDRIVVWRDKTRLTGWGEAGVPNFHGQFIPITGIVLLSAADSRQLPLTTTKRGLDAASNVYSQVKDLMRESTKEFTRFTNRWKNFADQRDEIYQSSEKLSLGELRALSDESSPTPFRPIRRIPGMSMRKPVLPEPVKERSHVRVSFLAEKSDVIKLGVALLDSEVATPAEVGQAAFHRVLENAGA